MDNIALIEEKLKSLKSKNKKNIDYYLPEIWVNGKIGRINVNPFDYFLNKIQEIRNITPISNNFHNWSNNSIVYNLFVRYATSYDHFKKGIIDIEPINGFRSTGTLLKSISILPYLYNMGINTIYLLPITSIGIDRKKGNLGSPYAIRNPYIIEPTLSETILELGAEIEFKAFSEAVHHLGMKLVTEFVFRTASVDSDIALEHPDWFYWIKAKVNERVNDLRNENQYGPPIFTKAELESINNKIQANDFSNLPEPHDAHKKMFTKAPSKLARVEQKIIGLINNGKTEVVIPSAFADWPPDDKQPLWSDVTYLKMYNHKDFNYIAYNTIRMYEKKLTKESNENKELWSYICNIIPYYIDNYNIDGIMLDMGHALPEKLRKMIVDNAKSKKEDFVFWEENFSLSDNSIKEGYNAVVGYMPFDFHIGWKIKELLRKFQRNEIPIHFFATPENHNTPRAIMRINNINYSKITYLISRFLPTITFIHNGFELLENNPVNTGLDFTEELIPKYPTDELPLFSSKMMDWNKDNNLINFIRQINTIYQSNIINENNLNNDNIELIENDNDNIICFKRVIDKESYLLVVVNLNDYPIDLHLENIVVKSPNCLINNYQFEYNDSKLSVKLNAMDFCIIR